VPFQGSSTVPAFNYPSFVGQSFYDFHCHSEKNRRVKKKTEIVGKENYLMEKKYFIVIQFNLFIYFLTPSLISDFNNNLFSTL